LAVRLLSAAIASRLDCLSAMNTQRAVFGSRLHAPLATLDPSPIGFPLGTMSSSSPEGQRYPINHASVVVRGTNCKLPAMERTSNFGNVFSPRESVSVGPNVRARPVVSVIRTSGFAQSGHYNTVLLRDMPAANERGTHGLTSPRDLSPLLRAERGIASLNNPITPSPTLRRPPPSRLPPLGDSISPSD